MWFKIRTGKFNSYEIVKYFQLNLVFIIYSPKHQKLGHWHFSFISLSFITETYIALLQDTTTQRRSQPSHSQRRRTWGRCKIWKGGPSARNVAQREDHSMLMGPQLESLGAEVWWTPLDLIFAWKRSKSSLYCFIIYSHFIAQDTRLYRTDQIPWQLRSTPFHE